MHPSKKLLLLLLLLLLMLLHRQEFSMTFWCKFFKFQSIRRTLLFIAIYQKRQKDKKELVTRKILIGRFLKKLSSENSFVFICIKMYINSLKRSCHMRFLHCVFFWKSFLPRRGVTDFVTTILKSKTAWGRRRGNVWRHLWTTIYLYRISSLLVRPVNLDSVDGILK